MFASRRLRLPTAAATVVGLIVALGVGILAMSPVADAAGTTPFVCNVTNPQFVYSLGQGTGAVNQVTTNSGAESVAASFTTNGTAGSLTRFPGHQL